MKTDDGGREAETEPFSSFDDLRGMLAALPEADAAAVARAVARDASLTKPAGSLGRLEAVAFWLAGWKGICADRVQIVIFAGNHGVVAQGVSAFPAGVTMQMVGNFRAGGAAVNQLAKMVGAQVVVEALELERPTCDFTAGPAMTEAEVVAAMLVGWRAVDPLADLLVPGEMGIGNTTAAAAMACALFGGVAGDWVGRGTGVDDAGLGRKAAVVTAGLALHAGSAPFEVLRCLGGREIAAMAGAILRARTLRLPVVLDGFIACAAAAVLARAAPGALAHCIAGHASAEAGHAALLAALDMEPLLALGLRLGEGSGAALAVAIVQAAAACHLGMATFGEAGVSQG